MKRTPLRAKKTTTKKKPIGVALLKKKLWEECKRIIRERHGNTCYTCYAQGLMGSNWHTGHFIPSSTCSVELRYSLRNLRPQCYRCNINLSGNWIEFEKHLINEHGANYPGELKQLNEQTKNKQYDILWYQSKLAEYKNL